MGKINKNILRRLFACLALAIVSVASSADPFDPPSQPGTPMAYEVNNKGCYLRYLPPVSDGGARIIGYYIEYKMIHANWMALNLTPTSELKFHVHSVQEGSRMEFRVIAVNKAGRSEPSDPSKLVTFETPK